MSDFVSITTVFAIDPGMDTGWAWSMWADRSVVAHREGELPTRGDWQAEVLGAMKLVELISRADEKARSLVRGLPVPIASQASTRFRWRKVIVFEGFTLRERTKDSSLLSPVRITSKAQTLLHSLPELWDVVDEQSASDKDSVKDAWLEAEGLWKPGKPHAMDALRHRILWERRNLMGMKGGVIARR